MQVAEQACLVLERYETPTKIFNMSGTDYHRHWRLNPRLESPLVKWTNKLREFIADKRSVDNYLEWLGWSWNHDTYVTQPVVKSGGRYARENLKGFCSLSVILRDASRRTNPASKSFTQTSSRLQFGMITPRSRSG